MRFIKVWCEYDISGEFGGNNNEAVYQVEEGSDVGLLVDNLICGSINMDKDENFEEEMEGLYDWEYITISKLGV
tara:strand:- start:1590 stop:1811 length:222 start_codon:yes stop_codon:yes gene_type:complete